MFAHRICAITAAFIGLLAIALALYIPRLLPRDEPVSGDMGRSEALRCAEPLCRALIREPNARLDLDAIPAQGRWRDGGQFYLWNVHCRDPRGRHAAYVLLDVASK